MSDSHTLNQYLDAIGAYPLLTAEAERELCIRAREGDVEARNHLVSSHLRFVVRVAKRFRHQGLSFHDLVQEGNLGLIRATERFDPERGFRFLSYASWWVRQGIVQALMDHGRTVRLPAYKLKRIRKAKRIESQLSTTLGRPASAEEVAAELGLSPDALLEDRGHARGPLQLDAEIFRGEDATLADVLADEPEGRPDSLFGSRHRVDRLGEALGGLSERHRRVLELHFGLNGEQPHTLEAIGRLYGFSRENARQLKARAMRKLRSELADLPQHALATWAAAPPDRNGLPSVEVA